MIKMLGVVFIISSGAFFGYLLNLKLKKRYQYLENLIAAFEFLKTHICVCDTGMKEALIKTDKATDTNNLFLHTAENMESYGVKRAFEDAVSKKGELMCLNNRDKEILISVSLRLGITESEDQKKNIDSAISLLKVQAEEAREILNKNGKLYTQGGVLCGMMIALLLI